MIQASPFCGGAFVRRVPEILSPNVVVVVAALALRPCSSSTGGGIFRHPLPPKTPGRVVKPLADRLVAHPPAQHIPVRHRGHVYARLIAHLPQGPYDVSKAGDLAGPDQVQALVEELVLPDPPRPARREMSEERGAAFAGEGWSPGDPLLSTACCPPSLVAASNCSTGPPSR